MEKDLQAVAQDSNKSSELRETPSKETKETPSILKGLGLDLSKEYRSEIEKDIGGSSRTHKEESGSFCVEYVKQLKVLRSLLPEFNSANSDNANAYLQKVDYYFRKAKVDERVFLEAIATTLEGPVGTWFITRDYQSYDNFVKDFNKEFCLPISRR